MTQKPDYNKSLQQLFLEMFLSDGESFIRCQPIFDIENFDVTLKPTAEFITKYADKYKSVPTCNIVNAACNQQLQIHDLLPADCEWLLDEFERFSRHKSLERAILASADLLEKGEYGPVETMIRNAVQLSLTRDMGTDYFEDPRTRLQKLKDSNGQVSTGWPSLDIKLFGGFNRGELNIFAAPSGGGKSLFLANLAINWSLQGLNVIYFTFELSEELVGLRMDSMMTNIPSREIFRNIDEVELRVKQIGRKAGNIRVKYMPSGKTANDLRAYIKEYSIRTGQFPDVILIDYLDLMMPINSKINPSDLYVKDKFVSEELRNLAMECKTLTVTASQFNRSAVEEVEFDHSHIAGGLSKIQTADNVFGIFSSRAMRERGRYQLQFLKTRNSSSVGHKIELDFDINTLKISDPGPDTETAQLTSIYQTLKRTSQVGNSPDTPVVKATGAARIRDLINQINNKES
jgi:archaellum biogenesis ATPase FlaH